MMCGGVDDDPRSHERASHPEKGSPGDALSVGLTRGEVLIERGVGARVQDSVVSEQPRASDQARKTRTD
jgi:hypothetical protein